MLNENVPTAVAPKEVFAAVMATTTFIENLTNDRIEALTKSHGMVNLAALCAMNAMTQEILRGRDIHLTDENLPELPVDHVLRVGIDAAREAGADPANAALLAATILNLAGANSRAGVPAGNRKLGALARMYAGNSRGGVQAIPSPKMTNKISGFAAVKALYDAMERGDLVRVDGADVPAFVAGGALYGHSALGEDYTYVDLATKGTQVAVEGMMKAYRGVGLLPSPFVSACLGAAAVLEIVNPDGMIADEYGEYFVVDTGYAVGKGAAQAAGLPEKLHMRGTGAEFDTARLIGDIGLILKDIGAPTVVGMIAWIEMMAAFQEAPMIGVGFSGGPVNVPLGHLNADGIVAMQLVLEHRGDLEKAADAIKVVKDTQWLDGELAAVSINTVAHKAEQIRRGPITRALILATESTRVMAIYRRAVETYEGLKAGRTLQEIIAELELRRQRKVEANASAAFSGMFGQQIQIRFTKLAGGARRTHPFAQKFWGFDADVDAEVSINGSTFTLEGLSHKVVPDAVLNKKSELSFPITLAAAAVQELMYVGHSVINMVVPAAVAAAMGIMGWKEAGSKAEEYAVSTRAIPGGKEKAREVARLAVRMMEDWKDLD